MSLNLTPVILAESNVHEEEFTNVVLEMIETDKEGQREREETYEERNKARRRSVMRKSKNCLLILDLKNISVKEMHRITIFSNYESATFLFCRSRSTNLK